MKKTLEDFSYNKDEWDIYVENDVTVFSNKKNRFKTNFYVSENIIGIMQVKSDSFLFLFFSEMDDDDTCSCTCNDTYRICRFRFTNDSPIMEYNFAFKEYEFISSDIIMFDSSRFYSIINNGEISQLNQWAIENTMVFCKGKLIAISDLSDTEFVATAINLKTYKSSPKAYSSLRDSYIKLSDDFIFEDLVDEDYNYIEQITELMAPEPVDIKKLLK